MGSNGRDDGNVGATKREVLIAEHLLGLGTNVEEAPDELLNEAIAYADKVLGVGKDN